MDLGYKKVEEIATSQIPFVTSNIELVFGFTTSPAYWFMKDVSAWGIECGKGITNEAETIRLAAHLIKYVNTPDGQGYELGSEESIKLFIEETSLDFLAGIIAGWLIIAGHVRGEHKKKQGQLSQASTPNGGAEIEPARA